LTTIQLLRRELGMNIELRRLKHLHSSGSVSFTGLLNRTDAGGGRFMTSSIAILSVVASVEAALDKRRAKQRTMN
jgi:hypothetical protein